MYNNINKKSFKGTFSFSYKLSGAIPEKLFKNRTKATNFKQNFDSCRLSTKIPEELFTSITGAIDFNYTFNDCTGVVGSVPKLWETHSNAIDSTRCFGFLRQENITNWSDILNAWK